MGKLHAQRPRAGLRAARREDLPFIEALEAGRSGLNGDLLVITHAGEDSPIGVLRYQMDMPSEGWAFIDLVALDEDSRRWGLGQEAVRIFEEDAVRRSSVRHFHTDVDVKQGLALYLWLRLGYRPGGNGTR